MCEAERAADRELGMGDKESCVPSHDSGACEPSSEEDGPPEVKADRADNLHALEEELGYAFTDIRLLDLSLTHKSFLGGEGQHSECNERLEFLGDSVLAMVVNLFLYSKFPEYTEGQLSKLKAVIVSRTTLALVAAELGLGDFIRFGPGETATGGSEKSSNLANALEALIASVYLDGGLEKAGELILSILADTVYELDSNELKRDYKTALQEYWQASYRNPPVYTVVAETGPDHDKRFEIEVELADEPHGRGVGKNKKQAEQKAAEKALEAMLNRRREDSGQ